jgi:hypothetical protein
MRFHLGSIPDEFTPSDAWRPIREPGPLLMQCIAAPIGLVSALLTGYGWAQAGLANAPRLASPNTALLIALLVASFPALIIVHEFVHAVVYPRFGLTSATIIGLWPRRLLFYAHHSGPLARNRFLVVFAMPLLVITIVPLAIALAGLLPPFLFAWTAWFSTWNALFACGDILGFCLIFFQVPRHALVQNQSWSTYWKPV